MSNFKFNYDNVYTVDSKDLDYISTNDWSDYTITTDWSNYTITTDNKIKFTYPVDPTMEAMDEMKKDIENIKRRLAILDDPSPEKLEKHKMLKEAYNKYKMIEALIGEKG